MIADKAGLWTDGNLRPDVCDVSSGHYDFLLFVLLSSYHANLCDNQCMHVHAALFRGRSRSDLLQDYETHPSSCGRPVPIVDLKVN